ncbi:hypothetical protein AVL50_18770 [Flammeovirga sp. SJP92]|nr:hypothetical protein AVL50_18770 [Flammeovirga sp. SJP92]
MNVAQAQDENITIGIGTGATIFNGRIDNYGINGAGLSFNINFYYHHTSNLAFGFERNGNIAIQILQEHRNSNFDVSILSTVVDYTLKVKYFIGESKVRPHLALGLGYYRTKSVLRSDDDMGSSIEIPLERYEAIGLSPELGMNFGFFQLSFISDIIPSTVFGHEGNSIFINFLVRATFNINTQSKKKTRE